MFIKLFKFFKRFKVQKGFCNYYEVFLWQSIEVYVVSAVHQKFQYHTRNMKDCLCSLKCFRKAVSLLQAIVLKSIQSLKLQKVFCNYYEVFLWQSIEVSVVVVVHQEFQNHTTNMKDCLCPSKCFRKAVSLLQTIVLKSI